MTSTDSRKRRRVERRVSCLVDRYAEDIGFAEMELLLQKHAQEMREKSDPNVTADDLKGWSQ